MNMHVGGAVKFKVGQRVKALDTACGQFTKGKSYVVSEVSEYGLSVEKDDGGTPNGWNLYNFEPAPLYAVGDKVRVVKTGHRKGGSGHGDSVGAVRTVSKIYEGGSGVSTEEWSFHFDEIEPYTEQPAAPKFKAGDRVRVVKDGEGVGGSRHGAQIGDVLEVLSVGPDYVDTSTWLFNADEVEPYVAVAPATATLTIQAGRYYQTRDGRKVGPMVATIYGQFVDKSRAITGYGWHSDGAFMQGQTSKVDLIAEWPVEPVVAPATTAEFKVGDRVTQEHWAKKDEATVVSIDDKTMRIRDDRGREADYTHIHFFKLVPPTSIADIVRKHSGTAVVMLIENGQPKPSTLPYVHYDRSSAIKEASRLAGIHKGSEFGVYECVDVKKVEKHAVVYDFEWQRLAAEGKKLNAIKELRGLTGLGLATAKDAVEDWLRRAA